MCAAAAVHSLLTSATHLLSAVRLLVMWLDNGIATHDYYRTLPQRVQHLHIMMQLLVQ
jgi:hypothetical protein